MHLLDNVMALFCNCIHLIFLCYGVESSIEFIILRLLIITPTFSILDPDEILKHEDFFNVKPLVKLSDLFDARVHLGHHEGCWNQHMKQYIYATRAHHHIIDLNKTVKHFQVSL